MAGLKADMPDIIDSGGAQKLGISFVKNQIIPLALGVAVAGLSVLLGLGLLSQVRPFLSQVPVLGTIMSAGQGQDFPSGWEGI
jgi:hypothetical protein